MRLILLSFLVSLLYPQWIEAQPVTIPSPEGSLQAVVTFNPALTISVRNKQAKELISISADIEINSHNPLFNQDNCPSFSHTEGTLRNEPVAPVKNAFIEYAYHEFTAACTQGSWTIRVFEDGIAYQFRTTFPDSVVVEDEQMSLHLPQDHELWFHQEPGFFSSNEQLFIHTHTDSLAEQALASLPLGIGYPSGEKLVVTESNLRSYPGLWIHKSESKLEATFPSYPIAEEQENDRHIRVTDRGEFLAKTQGTRSFPWRVFVYSDKDKDLLNNELVYALADDNELPNTDWIKPGKVAWDWWNASNLYDVPFKAGLNTDTYKYFIDFASEYGLEYVILDEGWSNTEDLLDLSPDFDVREIIRYGKEKNVDIILWVVWLTLDRQLEIALDTFQEWGAAGIKVDFMNRDDQPMVDYYETIAREAAKRKLLVNFHGSYKPTGLRKRFPNVITREGVKGGEHNKWSRDITPTHNTTMPFFRMLPGPIDYTPGAMRNAQPGNFRSVFARPMSMGTRAAEVAKFIVFESPLHMLADSPSNYKREAETIRFIAQIPTVWDRTIPLSATIGEHLVIARQHGNSFYIGGITNEENREFYINFSFLPEGRYSATVFQDGLNADRFAEDYRIRTLEVTNTSTMNISSAPAGGFAIHIAPEN
ncbi:MAG: glycoside hydrolase family 97 catalytic domain-containing protein [Bacteroidota bacterium]